LEKAFINPFGKNSSFRQKDDSYPEDIDDEEFIDDMKHLRDNGCYPFLKEDQSWRNLQMNFILDSLVNKSEKRKEVMKKYEDRLKELLHWSDPTPWIQTITTNGRVQNQVCIYFDADSKAPVNDWLQIRFQLPEIPMPQIRGPFIYIGTLQKPLDQETQLEMINYHKGIFHCSKYFGQPQHSEPQQSFEKYCNNMHKMLAHIAYTNVCNDPECKDCELQKINHESLADESERTGFSQDKCLEARELRDNIKHFCERKEIDSKDFILQLEKSATKKNLDPIVKEFLERY